MAEWTRIPAPFDYVGDRHNIVNMLTDGGMEVRVVMEKKKAESLGDALEAIVSAPKSYYVEFRQPETSSND